MEHGEDQDSMRGDGTTRVEKESRRVSISRSTIRWRSSRIAPTLAVKIGESHFPMPESKTMARKHLLGRYSDDSDDSDQKSKTSRGSQAAGTCSRRAQARKAKAAFTGNAEAEKGNQRSPAPEEVTKQDKQEKKKAKKEEKERKRHERLERNYQKMKEKLNKTQALLMQQKEKETMAIQQQRMYQQQSLSGAFPTSDALLHAHYFGSEGTGDDLSHQSALWIRPYRQLWGIGTLKVTCLQKKLNMSKPFDWLANILIQVRCGW